MKCIIHNSPDGLVVVKPNPKNRRPDETEDAFFHRVWSRYVETSQQVNSKGKIVAPHITNETLRSFVDISNDDLADKASWKIEGDNVIIGKKSTPMLRA
jgi:hypothetical protein